MTLAILLPAAGASARMGGRDKLMELVEDVPLLRRQTLRALEVCDNVYVTTRADRPARMDALAGLDVRLIPVADPDLGLSASLRAGVEALPEGTTALMVLLPDLPEIEVADLRRIIAAHETALDAILRATSQSGTPGHPTLFPQRYFTALMNLTGDTGAQSLLRDTGFQAVPLPGDRAITDLDTPEDWARWRRAQSQP